MSILLDETYHGLKQLQDQGLQILTQEPEHVVNMGVLNLMPQAECYELELLKAFSKVTACVRPVWLRVETHGYRSSNPEIIKNYKPYFQSPHSIHGLIVTGAPVEHLPFDDVSYWAELQGILNHAREHIAYSLGICWGGLAMARILGLNKEVFPKKQFGVFHTSNLDENHPLGRALSSRFHCPVSTHAGIGDDVWEEAEQKGMARLLAYSPKIGYLIAESADGRFLMHFGHPEYGALRLPEEFKRDVARGKTDVEPPENVDLSKPENLWENDAASFFEELVTRCSGAL